MCERSRREVDSFSSSLCKLIIHNSACPPLRFMTRLTTDAAYISSTLGTVVKYCFNEFLQQNRFAKCDICTKIKMDRKGCLDKVKQAELKLKLQEHLSRVE